MIALRGHNTPVRAIAYSPNGKWLLSGDDKGTVCLWDLTKQKLRSHLTRHYDEVRALAWSPDSKRILSGGWDDIIVNESIHPGRQASHSLTMPMGAWSLAWSPEQWQYAVGGVNQLTLRREGAADIAIEDAHLGPVPAVAFTPDGNTLASGSYDHTVKVWDANWGKCTGELTGHTDWVRCLAFSPTQRLLASAGHDHTVRLWSATGSHDQAPQWKSAGVIEGHSAPVMALQFHADGCQLISAGWSGTVLTHHVHSQLLEGSYNWDVGRALCMAIAPDGMTAAIGAENGRIVVWDID